MPNQRPSARIVSCYTENLCNYVNIDRYFIYLDYQCAYIIIQDCDNTEIAQELRSNTAGEFMYGPLYACHYPTWSQLTRMITMLLDIPYINLSFHMEYEPCDYYSMLYNEYD